MLGFGSVTKNRIWPLLCFSIKILISPQKTPISSITNLDLYPPTVHLVSPHCWFNFSLHFDVACQLFFPPKYLLPFTPCIQIVGLVNKLAPGNCNKVSHKHAKLLQYHERYYSLPLFCEKQGAGKPIEAGVSQMVSCDPPRGHVQIRGSWPFLKTWVGLQRHNLSVLKTHSGLWYLLACVSLQCLRIHVIHR